MEELKIVYRRLDELKVYENNPRNNEDAVERVAESIRQFGFKVPILIDENDVIIAGQRPGESRCGGKPGDDTQKENNV